MDTFNGSPFFYCPLGTSLDAWCESHVGKEYAVDHADTRREAHVAYIQHPVSGNVYGIYKR